jgi:predicted metal-dependent peptidase
MNPELKIERARQEIVLNQPFYGSLLLLLDPKIVTPAEVPGIADFATDGKHLLYYPAGVDKLTEDEVVGTLCHETLHCALGHMFRLRLKNHKVWNFACDYIINEIVLDSGLKMPSDSLFDKRFKNMSAEQVYQILQTEGTDDAKYLKISIDLVDPPDGMSEEEQQAEAESWKGHALQAAIYAKSHGTLPGSLESMLGELVKARFPWELILANFLTQTRPSRHDWSRPSRRSASMGLYLPNRYHEPTGDIVLCHDTSASVDDDDLTRFYSETAGLIQQIRPERCIIIQCDTYIRQVDEYTADTFPTDPSDILIKGRGGTSFDPPFRYLEEEGIEPSALVYFTDGECSYPRQEPDFPVLWALTYEQEAPPFGEYLCLDS